MYKIKDCFIEINQKLTRLQAIFGKLNFHAMWVTNWNVLSTILLDNFSVGNLISYTLDQIF